MRRTLLVADALISILLLVSLCIAQQGQARKPAVPMMTNDDVLSPRSVSPLAIESETRAAANGTPLRNARTILEGAISKMSELNSVRTRMQSLFPSGQVEVLVESMKPDRMHVVSPYGEMISIGRKFYVKGAGGWSVTTAKAPQSDAGLDFKTLIKQFIEKSGVKITGERLRPQTIDGIDTDAYAFEVSDGNQTGRIELNIGKDGYMRQMFLSGEGLDLKLWFSNLNEPLSIEPPM
jgi:hypothetical protein